MKLEIKLGEFTVNYELLLTDAPAAYDYHGVLVLHDFGSRLHVEGLNTRKPARLVAIPAHYFEFQCQRYGSGFHCAVREFPLPVLHLSERDLVENIIFRLNRAA